MFYWIPKWVPLVVFTLGYVIALVIWIFHPKYKRGL